MITTQRGFALIISIVLISVVLALGAALLDIAYKQLLLSSSAKNSQIAFYNADSALECALYWDQKFNAFNASAPLPSSEIQCNSAAITGYSSPAGSPRTTTFSIPCSGGGTSGFIQVFKQSSGSTEIYSTGYSSCDAGLNTRIERGFKIKY